ncbi:MAG: hypothetical protein R3190_14135, partial [Thermoanaerobaculia bacterium]|nr:hypothetical protein [Thermoanaerobaculia bacterium]
GLSRRTVGGPHELVSVGLGASIPSVETEHLVLSFPAVADAYAWIFPRPGGVSVGIAYDGSRLSTGDAERLLSRLLDRRLPSARDLWGSGRRYRYPIPLYSPSTARSVARGVARRVLLVGDAAGIADPLTREGIRYAALSGREAAAALAAGAPETYPRRLAALLGAEMERARRASRLFFDRGLGQWMVPVCRYHGGIRAVLGDLLACRQPYGGLRRRLILAALGSRGTH